MPTALLGAIAKFASQEEERPHLSAVLVDRSEVVACDGHRLVRAEIAVGPFEGSTIDDDHTRYLIPVAVARAIVAGAKDARGRRVRLTCAQRVLRAEVCTIHDRVIFVVEATTPTVTYPPIDQIMISTREGEPPRIAFNPRLLEDIAPVMDACGVSGLSIEGWGGDLSPMQFAAPGLRFVVMPMRAS